MSEEKPVGYGYTPKIPKEWLIYKLMEKELIRLRLFVKEKPDGKDA